MHVLVDLGYADAREALEEDSGEGDPVSGKNASCPAASTQEHYD